MSYSCGTEQHSLLLIERDALKRTCLLKSLAGELAGWRVVGVASSKQADAAELSRVALVLFDIEGPDACDSAVQNEIALVRARYTDASLVIICSAEGDGCILGAFRCGARGVFTASTTVETAIEGVRLVLAGGVYVPPSETKHPQCDVESFDLRNGGIQGFDQVRMRRWIEAAGSTETSPPFTARENDVLKELGQGRSNKIIAAHLGMSENTVKMHIQHIMRKLKVTNRTEAVVLWSRAGSGALSTAKTLS
jgi:DNA-binding NarL/FixJ family response regulator